MSDGERWAWQPQAGGAAEGAGGVVAPSLLARNVERHRVGLKIGEISGSF